MASVDASSGVVTALLILGIIQPGHPAIDEDMASTVGENYLYDRGLSTVGFERTVRVEDHGESSEFVVEWRKHVGTVIVPDSREVGIDAATGRVFRYVYINMPFEPPIEPVIEQSIAEASALRAVNGSPLARISSSELLVTFDPSGQQRLVWHVFVDDGLSHSVVEVDAETGTVIVIGRG